MDGCGDENLVAAARIGDKGAYAQLIERYYQQVFMVCLGMLGSVHDAEDAAQEAMLKGFVEIDKLRDMTQFGGWIVKIAQNLCLNLIRRKKHSRAILAEKAVQSDQRASRNDHLQQAIEMLPREIRLPLVMYYLDGQSVKNVARKLKMSPSGVYLKLRTGIKQLHELLTRQGDTQ